MDTVARLVDADVAGITEYDVVGILTLMLKGMGNGINTKHTCTHTVKVTFNTSQFI